MGSKVVAMILAGGKGTRLEALTKKIAKPAVSFGAKYRIIDFPLSNCANSNITTVGVLTQYESVALEQYIANGEKWGLNGVRSLTTTLAPRQTEQGLSWYKGTADAIYENIDFLDSTNPDYVLILSGDHIYSTTYDEMINEHIQHNADCTISVYNVPLDEASRFGILVTDKNKKILEFQEKPAHPTSTLASMGIYVFNYKLLRKALIEDASNEKSSHDFGKDIIPTLLKAKKRMFAYTYEGYWKDVGTIKSLHEANMDLLATDGTNNLERILNGHKIYSEDTFSAAQYIGPKANVKNSIISQGAEIFGKVENSVISSDVYIGSGAVVSNSVIMTGSVIEEKAKIKDAVIAPNSLVFAYQVLEPNNPGEIVLYSRKGKTHE